MTLQELVNLLCNHLASIPSSTPVLLDGSNIAVVVNKNDERNLIIEIKKA